MRLSPRCPSARAPRSDVDDLEARAGQQRGLAVALGRSAARTGGHLLEAAASSSPAGTADLELVALPLVAHPGVAAEVEARRASPASASAARAGLQLAVGRLQLVGRRSGETSWTSHSYGSGRLTGRCRRPLQTEATSPGTTIVVDAERGRVAGGVERAGAAVGQEREVARVEAAADDHVLERAAIFASMISTIPSAASVTESPSGSATLADRLLGEVAARLEAAALAGGAEDGLGVDVAEDQVGVGDGRLVAAAARSRPGRAASPRSAGRPAGRRCARRSRRSSRRRRRSRAPRRRGCGSVYLSITVVGGELRLAVLDDPDVEARAAHVGGDHVGDVQLVGEPLRADHAADRAGADRHDRPVGAVLQRHHAAVALHQHAGRSLKPSSPSRLLQLVQVARTCAGRRRS